MESTPDRVPLEDSRMRHPAGSLAMADAPRDRALRVAVVLRREGDEAAWGRHVPVIESLAGASGLRVAEVSAARRDVVLEGPIAAFDRAFGIRQKIYRSDGSTYRGHEGPIRVPRPLAGSVAAVVGLDDLPLRLRPHASVGGSRGASFTPPEIARHYDFPPVRAGAASRLALLEFGGGYHASDMDHYFEKLGLRKPAITTFSVAGSSPDRQVVNQPLSQAALAAIIADVEGGDGVSELVGKYGQQQIEAFVDTVEVTMDLQIAGAVANNAALEVYFAPDDAFGYRNAIWAALGEPVGNPGKGPASGLPAAISLSWGAAEAWWQRNGSGLTTIQDALQAASEKGVTVCCSSGDHGSGGNQDDGLAHVQFPASSPYALACGGTSLQVVDGKIRGEVAWNHPWLGMPLATGGGVSGAFPRPGYQQRTPIPEADDGNWLLEGGRTFAGRGVPDVAANADAGTGYRLYVGGSDFVGSGTSAAAPLWAALIALLGDHLGRPVGFLTPLLYGAGFAEAFADVTRGDNDIAGGKIRSYRAGVGWDACTGLGTPRGQALLRALGNTR